MLRSLLLMRSRRELYLVTKYNIPRCDCGGELYHWKEEMHTILTPITKVGVLSKRRIDAGIEDGAWERLRCTKCYQEYSYYEDSRGRIIRGDKWQ